MKPARALLLTTMLTSTALLATQSPTHARTWACRNLGIGCPQSIPGTSSNPPRPPEPTGFQVCNNSPANPIYVSFVTKKRGRFGINGEGASSITTSQGWWTLRSGQCQVVHSGNASDVVAVHAQGNGRLWGDVDEYCTHPTNAFAFSDQANSSRGECRFQGGRMASFFRTRNASRFFTFTFN